MRTRAQEAFRAKKWKQAAQLFGAAREPLTLAEYCCFGLGALLSGDLDLLAAFESSPVDGERIAYRDLYLGASLYDQRDPGGSQLILSAAPTITARGCVIDGQPLSWLRGAASFRDIIVGEQNRLVGDFSFPGGLPAEEILFVASADSRYFRLFYQSLSESFVFSPGRIGLLVNVVNPDPALRAFLENTAPRAREKGINFAFSDGPDTKWFYASSRFLLAEELICGAGKSVFAMDIDARFSIAASEIINGLRSYDAAYKEKGNCLPWQRVQAGRVWIAATPYGTSFVRTLGSFVRTTYSSEVDQWFLDQNALEYANKNLAANARVLNLNRVPHIRDGIFAPPGGKKSALMGSLAI